MHAHVHYSRLSNRLYSTLKCVVLVETLCQQTDPLIHLQLSCSHFLGFPTDSNMTADLDK